MAKLKFAKANKNSSNINKKSYKILIVDDEKSIHDVTNMAIKAMNFSDFDIEVFNAYSGKEAKEILENNDDIALAFIDVVMETPEAGLELVSYIRNELKNSLIRLIIRTGQANEYPEMDVIKRYDINDFKNKTELSMERLFTTVRTSVKQYEHLVELQSKYDETYKQMTTNQLTKLANRVKLYEDCNNNLNKTLILIDIVGFSSINENNGYDTGDFVLQELAGFLTSMYSKEFNIYHLDSDLFALVSLSDKMEIIDTVEHIKRDIAKLHIVTNNFNQTLDTTIGVAYQSEKHLMRKAELALKEARNTGKNKIKYYSEDLKIIQHLKDVNHWGPILKDGFTNGSVMAYYQPIYDLKTNKIEKYEMLVRLKHEGEVHSPFKFLEAATHTGQQYDIFKFMFEEACKQVEKTGYKFSVNIGDIEFENEDILNFITENIQKRNIDPSLLSIEILEYSSISSEDAIKDKINQIHDLGVGIAIDDFGINCSNFGQIDNLPVDILKIDGSFIRNLPTCENSQIIVKSIQTFAREKNIKLVAEYVCDEEVLKIVQELGMEYGQGYQLAKPRAQI